MPYRISSFLLVAAMGVLAAPAAQAGPTSLVSNGGFETTTNGNGQLIPNQTTGTYITSAPGWYTYNTGTGTDAANNNQNSPFLFITDNAVTTGFKDDWDKGVRYLWGASNGGANTWDGTSKSGGNYLVMDGDYHHTAISQNISGLVVGSTYALTFDWAAAQFQGFTGATTETLVATLGGQQLQTKTINLASTGFSGWMTTTLNFTYDGMSNVLSFLATGTPVGAPPMIVLDGVSLAAVPEPASAVSFGMALAGTGLLASLRRRRRRTASI